MADFELRNNYNELFFDSLEANFNNNISNYNHRVFKQKIFAGDWLKFTLKQRMYRISETLHEVLPVNQLQQLKIITQIAEFGLKQNFKVNSWEMMFLPDFIEKYLLDFPDEALVAIEKITCYTSCEFAVRKFILHYETLSMQKMLEWSLHKNEHVRRLSSEGCRPRLPWAIALPKFKKNPEAILPILENLKKDKSMYVRKSVANNLNDIAKDNPEIIIEIARKWKNTSPETDWIIRHGCRTLLKKGNSEIMQNFSLPQNFYFSNFQFNLTPMLLKSGNAIDLSINFVLEAKHSTQLRIAFVIHFVKQNGTKIPKVFHWVEKNFEGKKSHHLKKSLTIKPLSTRKLYSGTHDVSIQINGKIISTKSFNLLV